MSENDNHIETVWTIIDEIAIMLLDNAKFLNAKRSKEFTINVMEKFGLTERTAQRYISEARKDIRKLKRLNKETALEEAIRARYFLKAKAKENGDYKLLLEVEKDLSKLFGLYVDEIKHSGTISINNIDLSKLTDEQLSILESIIKKGEDPKPYLLSVGINVKSN